MYRAQLVSLLAAAVAVGGFLTPATTVFADGGDIGIFVSNGRIVTGTAVGEPPTQTFNTTEERVFLADLAYKPLDLAVQIDEPGLASNDAAILGQAINFTITKAARKWNGGDGDFDPSPLTLSGGRVDLGITPVTTPASDVDTALGTIPVFPDDFHYLWTLDGAGEFTGQGIYLVEGFIASPGGTLLPSKSIFLVFNYGLDELEHERAEEYVRDVLVPAPGTAALLALGGVMTVRRRRAI